MKVFELKLKLYLLEDIKQEKSLGCIAAFIDEVLARSEELLKLHQENCFKNYVFCSFYPVSKEGVYQKDNIYTVMIRTIDRKLADYFTDNLPHHSNRNMKGLKCEISIVPKRLIEKVYSLTPILLKDSEGYWKKHMSQDDFDERLKVNLIKKYNSYTGDKLSENFRLYTTISFLNKMPIKVPYKGIHLLGDKIELLVSDDPQAQELIYMSLGTGVCENNSRGFGFMSYKWRKEGQK